MSKTINIVIPVKVALIKLKILRYRFATNFRFRSQKQKKLLKMSKPSSQRNGGIQRSIFA